MPQGAEPTRTRALLAGLFVAIAPLIAPSIAAAQSAPSGALDRFDPSFAGDTLFSVPSADVAGRVRLAASATISYAHDPLVLRTTSGSVTPLEWVSGQAILHAQVSLELMKRLKVDVDLPALLTQSGASGALGTIMVTAPSGAHVSDVRVGARAVLVHQHGFVPAASLTFSLWAPAGDRSSFAGAGVVRYEPGVAIGAEYTHVVWGASVGTRFQPAIANALIGSQVVGSAGVAFRAVGLTIGPEIAYGVSLGDQRDAIVSNVGGSNVEALLGARYRIGPLAIGLAAGPGLGRGPGTPTYRVLGGLSAAFDVLPATERSDDEAGDRGDRSSRAPVAPPAPAPVRRAEPDTDGDGVPDTEDACPNLVGDATPGAYRRGCPADRDHDGVFDADDACPDVPGIVNRDPKKNGCPSDRDGDGIPDDADACPDEKGKANADPRQNGCPTAVRVEGTQIVILQDVNFETGRDTITPDSFGTLGQVATVLKDHPDIARVAVDGHTDNVGAEKANVALSERRAIAVVRWVIDHGVDARRLEARGFGPRRPIADNKNDAGRAKNRRVEFQIRRRTNEGEAGWLDGPITVESRAAPSGAAPAKAIEKAPK